jgi:hypothetical protein
MTNHLPALPSDAAVAALLGRYKVVELGLAPTDLSARDKSALRKLVAACAFVDAIYWRQRSELGPVLRDALARGTGAARPALRRLLALNFGPWDALNDERPFWGEEARPPGGTLYPVDLSQAEMNRYVDDHPEERAELLAATSLVRRVGPRLASVPYSVAYGAELSAISELLCAASLDASNQSFAEFLRARARDLTSGDLADSERQWLALSSSPIDIAIGPFEVYDDDLMGLKASYEATVLLRHPLSDRLQEFESVLPELERDLPGSATLSASGRTFSAGVYDVVHAAGMTNIGTKAIAAMLPNDETVRQEAGARLLLFNNVAVAKFEAILRPIADAILVPDEATLVREEAFVLHTILHETAHALVPSYVGAGQLTANQALLERYSTIEESRADLIGLVYLWTLVRSGLISATVGDAAYATFVASCVRSLRFGMGSDYARGAAMILSYLHEAGALRVEGDHLRLFASVAERAVGQFAARLQAIATTGDYAGAGKLMDRYWRIPVGLPALLGKIEHVPVDLEFSFERSRNLLR